jgi:hypothetical protein
MPYQYPFMPIKNSTNRTMLGAEVASLIAPEHGDSLTLYVDNRGTTDVLIEFDSDPSDLTSFPIPAGMSQPIGIGNKRDIRIKRPAGTLVSEEVITTFGLGA